MLVSLEVGWPLDLLGFGARQDLEKFFLGVGYVKYMKNLFKFFKIFSIFSLKNKYFFIFKQTPDSELPHTDHNIRDPLLSISL